MQLQLRTMLNFVHPLKSFVYADIRLTPYNGGSSMSIKKKDSTTPLE